MYKLNIFYYRIMRKLCHFRQNVRGVDYWTNSYRTSVALPVLCRQFNDIHPPHVQIETTTDCNYHCSFCPQSVCPRPAQYVSDNGFTYFLEQLKRVDFPFTVSMGVNNEPFMHPLLMTFCEKVAVQLPKAIGIVVTNGSLIRHEHLDFLAGLPKPPILMVNDYTKNRSVSRNITEWRRTCGHDRMIIQIRMRSSDQIMSNRAGNHPGTFENIYDFRHVICTWPFYCMFFSSNLEAFLCCADYHHTVILGDLKSQDLMSIWQGDAYREIRHKLLTTRRRDLPLCGKCNDVRFSLPDHCKPKKLGPEFY